MAEGGDIFDPHRLRKLWEKKAEDPFEKREREEKEIRETEPTLEALDLYDGIVRTCRRRLGGHAAPLEPVFKHARGLLAVKLSVDREEAKAAAAPPASAEPDKKAAPAPKRRVEDGSLRSKIDREAAGRLDDEDRKDKVVLRELAKAKRLAGIVTEPKKQETAALPAELGAALDMIEDLYEVLSSRSG